MRTPPTIASPAAPRAIATIGYATASHSSSSVPSNSPCSSQKTARRNREYARRASGPRASWNVMANVIQGGFSLGPVARALELRQRRAGAAARAPRQGVLGAEPGARQERPDLLVNGAHDLGRGRRAIGEPRPADGHERHDERVHAHIS